MSEIGEILYLCQHGDPEPWRTDFLEAARDRVAVRMLDPEQPLAPQFEGVAVVVDQGGHATRAIIDAGAAAGVRLWQVIGTGLDHTEVEYILDQGIALANTPGQFSAVALAEHALFLVLALAKKLPQADRNCRSGQMYAPVADELAGRVLGIVGLGASGRELARRASALGMRVRAVEVAPVSAEELEALGIEQVHGLDGLNELLAASDYVSLHLPLTAATRHLIDARRLALMKPTAGIVNVARGRIIDEEALVEALRHGTIAGAGIDVFGQEPLQPDHPLLGLDDIVVTPHIAGVTRGTSRRRSEGAVENVLRVLKGEDPHYRVYAAD